MIWTCGFNLGILAMFRHRKRSYRRSHVFGAARYNKLSVREHNARFSSEGCNTYWTYDLPIRSCLPRFESTHHNHHPSASNPTTNSPQRLQNCWRTSLDIALGHYFKAVASEFRRRSYISSEQNWVHLPAIADQQPQHQPSSDGWKTTGGCAFITPQATVLRR
jgi:hypothetical protein